MVYLTLTLREVQEAARKTNKTDLKDAQEAARWLRAEYKKLRPESRVNFYIGELANGEVKTVKASTFNDDNALVTFVESIRSAGYTPNDAEKARQIMEDAEPIIEKLSDATSRDAGITFTPIEVQALTNLISMLLENTIQTMIGEN